MTLRETSLDVQLFKSNPNLFLEKVIKHANIFQEKQSSSQHSLFGDEVSIELPDPKMPECTPWSKHEQLKFEKEVTGFYISGHPLDDYKTEIGSFCNVTLEDLHSGLLKFKGKPISFAGMVISAEHRTAKTGNLYGTMEIEDFTDSFRLTLFSEEYMKYRHLMVEGSQVFIQARVEANRNNPNRLEVKVSSMLLLAEVMQKFARKIMLEISLLDLEQGLVNDLFHWIKTNPGQCELTLRLRDPDESYSLGLIPKKVRVNASGLALAVREMDSIDLWINGNRVVKEISEKEVPEIE